MPGSINFLVHRCKVKIHFKNIFIDISTWITHYKKEHSKLQVKSFVPQVWSTCWGFNYYTCWCIDCITKFSIFPFREVKFFASWSRWPKENRKTKNMKFTPGYFSKFVLEVCTIQSWGTGFIQKDSNRSISCFYYICDVLNLHFITNKNFLVIPLC